MLPSSLVQHRQSCEPTTMDSASDLIMDGPGLLEHPDPAVKERLQSFSELGELRCKLAEWLNKPGSLQIWRYGVAMARKFFKERTASGPLTVVEGRYLNAVWGLNTIRKCLTAYGMDPEVLVELYGKPDEYDVETCSNESLVYLLCHGSDVDLLIGSGIQTKIINAQSDDGVMIERESQSMEEAAIRLNSSFTAKFHGPVALWLKTGLEIYKKLYNENIHYGKAITVLQSSGTGKSRAAAELAKSYWGVSICFRGMGHNFKRTPDPRDGFPLGDIPVFEFLTKPSKVLPPEVVLNLGPLKSEEIAAAFLGAFCAVLYETMVDARRGRDTAQAKIVFDPAWGIPGKHPENSPRYKNFVKVQGKAIALLTEGVAGVLKARDIRTVSTKSSPQIPQGEQDNSGNQMEISAAISAVSSGSAAPLEATKGTPSTSRKKGIGPWVQELHNVLVKPSAEALNQELTELGLSSFIFTFDECCLLNFTPRERAEDRITLLAMQRAIKACDRLGFWFLMLDTTAGLGDIYPNADETANSWRLQNDFKPLPPFPFMPYDVMVPSPETLSKIPMHTLQLDNLCKYGRPLWSLYHDDEIMCAAARKLLCARPEQFLHANTNVKSDARNLQVLALHSTRFILNLYAEGAAKTMAINSVKSHMRLLTDYDAETGILKSVVPSEPILAIAAGWLLLSEKEVYIAAMRTLVEELLLANDIISIGEKGETLARIILIVTRDATVAAAGGQLCNVDTSSNKIVEENNRGSHLQLAVRPFTLKLFLQNLLNEEHIRKAGLQWTEDVHLNFTHFAQLSNFVDETVTVEFLVMCWQRGVALQCVHNQAVIDAILVGYSGDLSEPFDPEKFVFVVLQFKNRGAAAELSLIKTITTPFIKFKSKTWKPRYIAILMDLGTPTRFGNKNGPCVQITSCKAEEGQYWSAFDESQEVEADRINIRGYDAYSSLAEWAPAMLYFQTSNADSTGLSTVSHKWESTLNIFQDVLGMSSKQLKDRHTKQQKG